MILVVDDDPSVTASLALLLRQQGCASESMHAPEAALAAARRPECAFVIRDMNCSRRTIGEEGLQLLAQLESARLDLPVIPLTA